ncbi:MAG TPA: TolC family protein [Gammaproteobacteria bacterium]|nr:TolC family protein [Gammaproteobacteria bacterium]
MHSSVLRALLACAPLLAAASAAAQAPPERAAPRELTLASAVDLALARNPSLAASLYELTAAQGRIVQADLRVNPELRLELENFAGTGSAASLDALETTLSLSQVIELGGKRDLRRGVAEAGRDLAIAEQRARELDVLGEVARRFVDVAAAQERVRYARAGATLASQTLDAITRRVDAARSPVAEQSRARIALTRATIEQREAESDLVTARHALAALWGDAEPGFGSAAADLFRLEANEPFETFFARLERTPEILAFASQARLHDAELELAQAQARQNLAVEIGVRRLAATDDWALVAGFSRPLGVRNRNEGAILEARARRAQTEAERGAALNDARAALFGVYQAMTTARDRTAILRAEAVPQAETALRQVQAGYDVGRFSFLELVTAQQELLELQQAAIDSAASYHRFRTELERLTNEPLAAELEAPTP